MWLDKTMESPTWGWSSEMSLRRVQSSDKIRWDGMISCTMRIVTIDPPWSIISQAQQSPIKITVLALWNRFPVIAMQTQHGNQQFSGKVTKSESRNHTPVTQLPSSTIHVRTRAVAQKSVHLLVFVFMPFYANSCQISSFDGIKKWTCPNIFLKLTHSGK